MKNTKLTTMKKLSLFIPFFLLSFFLFINCSDSGTNPDESEIIEETPEKLTVSKDEITFISEGEKQNVTIEADGKWKISVNESSWCEISKKEGEGDATIEIKIAKNIKRASRSNLLTISYSEGTEYIKITQDASPTKPGYLPLVTINTENNATIKKEDYVNATIKIESRNENGNIHTILLDAETEIKGRGNSTWNMEKKPYRLKLKKSSEVLGMPKNKHWVLLANYADKSLMRNELAFEISRRMGFTYTPRMQYVDVVLNGDYVGSYMLGEHIRIDKERVNIAEMEANDSNITGGYLLEIDQRKGEPVWFETTETNMIFCVSRPEDIPANQKAYISSHIQKLEDVLYGKLGDPVTELPKYMDIKSFIDYFLLNELAKNVDGNLRLSTYLYKDKDDDRVYFGPVWDYDIAFGNVNYNDCWNTYGWYTRNNPTYESPWYQKFFAHPEFFNMAIERWKELRSKELHDLMSFIDVTAEDLDKSQQKNFERWTILGKYVWPNKVWYPTYQGEVDYLKSWVKGRLSWMDLQLK